MKKKQRNPKDKNLKTCTRVFFKDKNAVSEVVGSMLLLLVAVVSFIVLLSYIFPIPFPPESPHVDLTAWVQGDYIVIENKGGNSLPEYTEIIIITSNGSQIRGTLTDASFSFEDVRQNNLWDIGEFVFYKMDDDTQEIRLMVIDIDTNSLVLDGVLRKGEDIIFTPPLLVSSLLTNTTDEDLICYAFLADDPSFGTITRVYHWYKNGESITQLLMPFDTENSTITKDYSGYNNNGTISEAVWTNEGKLGGAYYFDGNNDHIEVNLPPVFDDIPNNDFTISLWTKSDDIDDPWRVTLEARKDNNNCAQFFQYDSALHFGITDAGTRRSVKTGRLMSDVWYNIVGIWDASENSLKIYVNGEESTPSGNINYGAGSHESIHIGQRTDGSRNWAGFIDEIKVCNYTLSAEQIYQDYLDMKDGLSRNRVVVSQETNLGDVWMCEITPNNGAQDADATESNLLTIIPYDGGQK
jgi:hypothetical protein